MICCGKVFPFDELIATNSNRLLASSNNTIQAVFRFSEKDYLREVVSKPQIESNRESGRQTDDTFIQKVHA
jgi:hypothetical protein